MPGCDGRSRRTRRSSTGSRSRWRGATSTWLTSCSSPRRSWRSPSRIWHELAGWSWRSRRCTRRPPSSAVSICRSRGGTWISWSPTSVASQVRCQVGTPAGSSSASRLTSSPCCYASSGSRPFGCRPGCSSSSSPTPSMGSGSLRASRCSAPRAGRYCVRPGRRHLGARQRPASGPSYVSEVYMTRARTDHDRLAMPVTDHVPGGGSWRLAGMSRWACSTRRTSRWSVCST